VIHRGERHSVDCSVQVTSEEGTTTGGRLLNLSLGGCAIESAAAMDSGLYIALKISLTEQDPPVHIEMGRVQWATHHQFGVKFLLLDKQDRQALERWVRKQLQQTPASGLHQGR
jgi:hypothetical protein